ncbi:Protein MKS1 [Platanthera zijinensis]|uniref:Protein MKS1 n=1 Tax=Platanthera zijinensis TaxID=2320716 RepID=A0AAP0FZI4_9ASPA
MDLFEQTRGCRPSPRPGIQLQGPRPSPLKVNKDSHKLKKPSFPPPAAAAPAAATSHRRPPVIIYTVSPKIIHTKPSEFMSLVQRLTGCASSSESSSAAAAPGALVPDDAENRASPKQNSPASAAQKEGRHEGDELRRLVIGGGSAMSTEPSSPGMQLMSQTNFFSPSVVDINQLNFFHELNVPALNGGNKGIMGGGGFMATPGNFFFSL